MTPRSYFPYTVRDANPRKLGLPLPVRVPGYSGVWFRSRDGLPSNYVQAIAVDHGGTVWLGTDIGAVSMRPDGASLRLYTTMRDGLAYDEVEAIAVDREGELWFGGNLKYSKGAWGAVSRYDGRDFYTWRNTGDSGVDLGVIEALAVDARGDKWLATTPSWFRGLDDTLGPGGVIRLSGRYYGQTTWAAWTVGDGISFELCDDVVADGRGNVWVLAEGRLARWGAAGGWTDVARVEGEPRGWVRGIAVDPTSDTLIVATVGMGERLVGTHPASDASAEATEGALLWRTPEGRWTRQDGAPAARAERLAVDRSGNIWYSRYIEDTERVGVRWADGTWFLFNETDGPLYSWIHDIYVDASDSIWFGTSEGAVALLKVP